jgi:hypothetical protein
VKFGTELLYIAYKITSVSQKVEIMGWWRVGGGGGGVDARLEDIICDTWYAAFQK